MQHSTTPAAQSSAPAPGRSRPLGTTRRDERGFTLVEVLVSLVILSLGLLGVAKLVMGAVRANDSAYMRGQATQLAYAILDQMRANPAGAQAGNYVYGAAVGNPGNVCMGASCQPAVLAQLDLWNWQTRLQQALPAGQATIATAITPTGTTLATVTVSWNDNRAQWAFGTPSGTTPGLTSIQVNSIL